MTSPTSRRARTLNVLMSTPRASIEERTATLRKITDRLDASGTTLPAAIAQRNLYFRLSLVGACNLTCPFCHNEGAPARGRISRQLAFRAAKAAADVGFARIQLTGGEPLLHPEVGAIAAVVRQVLPNVGITTNGTLLEKKADEVFSAGISRLHVSLQVEPLRDAGKDGAWGVPTWLAPLLDRALSGSFVLQLNMPVPHDQILQAEAFLRLNVMSSVELKVFAVLPEGQTRAVVYPAEELARIVKVANGYRESLGHSGRVTLRGFDAPTGIRCSTCPDRGSCKEQSRSLRMGADGTLRPCLATRRWDSNPEDSNLIEQMTEAALFAIDYFW